METDKDTVDHHAAVEDQNEDQNGNNPQHAEPDAKVFLPGRTTPGENIVARMPAERDAIFYNMNHEKRGMAIIYNHKYFEGKDLAIRNGTDTDCNNLKYVLKNKFGFAVSVCTDYSAEKVSKSIAYIASMDHSNHDCIVVCVLTHGLEGILFANDTSYETKSIWEPFTANKCPTLAGKPKIFFFQACQGDLTDAGVTVCRTQADGVVSYKIPNQADFLIGCSTVPGYLSWRNNREGSWYIQALVKELRENGTKRDLVTLLTFVNQKVAFHFESYKPNEPEFHMKLQVPSFTCRFTRLCIFGNKSASNNQ